MSTYALIFLNAFEICLKKKIYLNKNSVYWKINDAFQKYPMPIMQKHALPCICTTIVMKRICTSHYYTFSQFRFGNIGRFYSSYWFILNVVSNLYSISPRENMLRNKKNWSSHVGDTVRWKTSLNTRLTGVFASGIDSRVASLFIWYLQII